VRLLSSYQQVKYRYQCGYEKDCAKKSKRPKAHYFFLDLNEAIQPWTVFVS
jgi:hypothetical protein